MTGPSPSEDYFGEPGHPRPWTTSQPLEGLRETNAARIVSLSPDVCLTPMGATMVPVPYPVVDYHAENYAGSVRFTGQAAMVLRSNTAHVHGDAPGTGKGVKSGTVGGISEPIGHAAQVRAEGSPVIRHLDRFWMNNRNTVGEATFVRDTATHPAPADDDPLPGSLFRQQAQPVQLPQAGAGAMAGGGVQSGAAAPAIPLAPGRTMPGSGLGRLGIFGWMQLLDGVSDGRVSRQRIENGILPELDYYATTPGKGLTAAQMGIVAEGAAEIRRTALPAADFDAADAIRRRTWDRVAANASAEDESEADAGSVRITRPTAQQACDEVCEIACKCWRDRDGTRTYTDCVSRELRRRYNDPDGDKFPDDTPRRPRSRTADGPRPEVNYLPDGNGDYRPVESGTATGMPSTRPVIAGAPRPDISWWRDGRLWRIIELKFPGDEPTRMQRDGLYERIARDHGLDPEESVVTLDLEAGDCECTDDGGKARAGRCPENP